MSEILHPASTSLPDVILVKPYRFNWRWNDGYFVIRNHLMKDHMLGPTWRLGGLGVSALELNSMNNGITVD